MSPSAKHRQQLDADLRAHERRLAYLRDQIAHLQEEASAHELLMGLGSDGRLMQAIEEVDTGADAADECARDPHAFLVSRGVRLPEDAQVTVERRGNHTVGAVRLATGRWRVVCRWDSESGFSTEST